MRQRTILPPFVLAFAATCPGASFDITYTGMPPAGQAAFGHAAGVWETILVSPVPIKVQALFIPMGGATLGITFPNGRRDFPGAPINSTWYATALANSIAGVELNPGEDDINIYFDSGADWYFGTDGNTPAGQYDFVSVALHELGHGLGFVGVAKKDGAIGSFGLLELSDFAPLVTSFPWPELDTLPGIFDRSLQAPTLEMLTDLPNPSASLGSFFTCNDLNWNGPNALAASGGAEIRIYAPSTFALGSSCVHLNEATYPVGNANELMTPFIATGHANHWPGPICLGILQDIGWQLSPDASVAGSVAIEPFHAWPDPATTEIHFSPGQVWETIRIIDASGRPVRATVGHGTIDVSTLAPGGYLIEVGGDPRRRVRVMVM